MRDYLSASAINLFLQCPTSYFLKYQLGLETDETDPTYARYGTLVHNILENIANNDYLFEEEAVEEYIKEFPSTGMQMDGYYEEGIEAVKRGWNFFEDFTIERIGAEVKFNVKPFEDIPKYFGFIDLVYRDSNGNLVVRDYKTSKPYTDKQLEHQIQPYFYAEACLAMYGELPKYFEFEFVRFNKKKTIVIDEEFLEFNRLRMQGIWNKIVNNILKSNWQPYYCEHFCANSSLCPLFQMKKGGK